MPRPGRLLLAFVLALALIVPAQASAADQSGWSANATTYRGQNGSQFTYDCPKYGTIGGVYGTDVYTDDSSVCTAAVHAGRISLAGGGLVTIEIRPDAGSYTGSTRNRITSSSYGAWQGAYVIVAATPQDPGIQPVAPPTGTDPWALNATAYRNFVGAEYQFNCPGKGTPRNVWGTDVYTDDSSVCGAAVHAGLITISRGGKVVIQMVDGRTSYRSSKRNGIKSLPYGTWGGSYLIVDAPGGPDDVNAVATGNVTVNGQPFTSGRVKYGSTIDVSGGTLQLTAAGVGRVLTFGDGADLARFKLGKVVDKVGKKKRTTAELALNGGDFSPCTTGARASAGPAGKVVRSLWAQGSGRFRTKGKYASAAIRGTKWQTTDECDGTLTAVAEGAVTVRDFRLKKNVVVTAGNSYLAKAP